MDHPATPSSKLSVVLISDYSDLAVSIARNLVLEGMRVLIYSNESIQWINIKNTLGDSVHILTNQLHNDSDYVLMIDLDQGIPKNFNGGKREKYLQLFNKISNNAHKAFIIIPYIQRKNLHQATSHLIHQLNCQYKIIYIGDLVFEKKSFTSGTILRAVSESVNSDKSIDQSIFDSPVFPVDGEKVSKIIIKKILSFSDSVEALIGLRTEVRTILNAVKPHISCDQIENTSPFALPRVATITTIVFPYDLILKLFTQTKSLLTENVTSINEEFIEIKKLNSISQMNLPKTVEKKKSILTPLSLNHKDTLEKINQVLANDTQRATKSSSKKKIQIPKFRLTKKYTLPNINISRYRLKWRRKYSYFAASFLLVLLLPHVLLVSSFLISKVGHYYAYDHAYSRSVKWYNTSQLLLTNSQNMTDSYTKIPVVGEHYETIWYVGKVLNSLNTINKNLSQVKENSILLFESIVTDTTLSSKDVVSSLNSSVVSLDSSIQFLSAEMDSETKHVPSVLSHIMNQSYISDEEAQFISYLKSITSELPSILGHEKPQSYAIVLYDSRKPQTLGGSNYAVLVITLSGGKLVDVTTYSSDFIDRNVEGSIEPLPALRTYFGRENFLFEDSGWNTDYTKSVDQIKWFLDKSFDINVGGVITVNSEILRKLLTESGNIQLTSAGQSLSAASFDTVFYGAIDADSEYVSTVIDELWGSMLRVAIGADLEKRVSMAKIISSGIEYKDVQINNSKQSVSRVLKEMNWSGELANPECVGNCVTDFVSISENSTEIVSNLVRRESVMNISLEQGLLKRELTYTISNASNTPYKTYINLKAPSDVGFGVVKINGSPAELPADKSGGIGYKTIGFLTQIPANSSQEITVPWESGINTIFSKNGDYYFSWLKQPGMKSMPVTIEYTTPQLVTATVLPSPSLTEGNVISYNSQLEKDILSHLFW